MTDVDTLQRANRYSRDQLADLVKTGTPRERDLAAVVLANLDVRTEQRNENLQNRSDIRGLEEGIKHLEKRGDSAAGPVLKVAPAGKFSPNSIDTDEEFVRVDVAFSIPVEDLAPAFAAFAEGVLWLCAVPGVNNAEST